MSDSDSDPKIIARLNKLPPFTDEQGNIVSTPPPDVTQPVEEPKEEPKVEKQEEPEITEPAPAPVEEAKEEPKEEPDEKEALDNAKNPERTKKYIDSLKKQNETLKRQNVLDSLVTETKAPEAPQWPAPPTTKVVPTPQQYPGLTQPQINDVFKGLIDENGYVDTGLLISTLNDLKETNRRNEDRAKQAEDQAKQNKKDLDDFQRNQLMRQVHEAFPKLDPDNADAEDPARKFDDKLWQYVRKGMVAEWIKDSTFSDKPVDPNDKRAEQARIMGLAQKGMELLNNDLLNDEGEVDVSRLTMKKAEKEKMEQAEIAKRNINATSVGQTSQRENYSDHEALVKATRMGQRGALAERLRQAGQ